MAKKRKGEATDFGQIAERLEAQIDFNKISSKEDYKTKIKQLVRGNKSAENIIPYLDDVYEEGNFKKELEKRELEEKTKLVAIQQAQRLERARPRRSRISDERKTAKTVLPVTRRNLRRWKRGRYVKTDLRGIDTALAKKRSETNMITQKDLRLPKGYTATVNSLGIKQYRRGGMFVSAKKIRRMQERKMYQRKKRR